MYFYLAMELFDSISPYDFYFVGIPLKKDNCLYHSHINIYVLFLEN